MSSIAQQKRIDELEKRIGAIEGERRALRRTWQDVANAAERVERKVDRLIGAGLLPESERVRIKLPFPRCLEDLGYERPKENA